TLRHLVTGLGALGAATGGLALRALTATHAGTRGLGAGRRAQVVHLQGAGALLRRDVSLAVSHDQSTSSTVTRWSTVLTIPRISGRSSLTTTSPMRFRPRLRRVLRWLSRPPISERVWVTFSWAIMHPPSPCRRPRRDQRPGRAAWRPGRPRPAACRGARPRPPDARGRGGPPPPRGRC